MKQQPKTVTVELPTKLAVFLTRLMNQNYTHGEALLATEQAQYAGAGKNIYLESMSLTNLGITRKDLDSAWGYFNAACVKHGINWKQYKEEPPVMIGGYEVKFNNDNIQVGCQTITNSQIREIAKKQGIM